MRNITATIAIGFTCIVTACSVTHSQTDMVEILGSESDEQKLASAEAIGNELWNGPLKPYIMQSVPGVSAADLDAGLGLRWETFKIKSFTGSERSAAKVHIKCIYGSKHQDERITKIVAACKQLVSEAVKKHYESKAKA